MKYKTRQWLDAVIALRGDTPFRMMDLPQALKVRSEIKPLVADGIMQEVKWEYISGRKVPTWKVSSKYIASQKKKTIYTETHSRYLFDDGRKSIFNIVSARCYTKSDDLFINDAVSIGDVVIADSYKVAGVLV